MDGTGIVLASFGRTALVEAGSTALPCAIAGRQLRVVCGDRVHWHRERNTAEPLITRCEPRRNVLERIDSRGKPEPVAANIDALAVVLAPRPEPDWFLIDRYCAAAALKDLKIALIVNKRDLGLDSVQLEIANYHRMGVPCFEISIFEPQGLQTLRDSLTGRATMLVGQSGVGKSSIINTLVPDAAAQTALLTRDIEGRHTTTTARWYRLDSRTSLLDAPGVRDFAPPALLDRAAQRGFVEIHTAAAECKFNDCRHFDEPNCAVRKAVASGEISARRHDSYRRLLRLYERFAQQR
jgi:ribosome biogenesis GTPase / thiamine phosphate phosphatase